MVNKNHERSVMGFFNNSKHFRNLHTKIDTDWFMKRYYLTAYCTKDRYSGISDIEKAVSSFGFISEHKLFTDISLGLVVEINENKISGLYKELKRIVSLKEKPGAWEQSGKNCVLLLNVTFTKGTGELEIEVPDVPG